MRPRTRQKGSASRQTPRRRERPTANHVAAVGNLTGEGVNAMDRVDVTAWSAGARPKPVSRSSREASPPAGLAILALASIPRLSIPAGSARRPIVRPVDAVRTW